jgi:hypothetical protein
VNEVAGVRRGHQSLDAVKAVSGGQDDQRRESANHERIDKWLEAGNDTFAGRLIGICRGVAIGDEPWPASLEKTARFMPNINAGTAER